MKIRNKIWNYERKYEIMKENTKLWNKIRNYEMWYEIMKENTKVWIKIRNYKIKCEIMKCEILNIKISKKWFQSGKIDFCMF